DGRILASASLDGTATLWGGDELRPLLSLGSPRGGEPRARLFAFHPAEPLLAILDEKHAAVLIYRLTVQALQRRSSAVSGTGQCQSVKVVLVGNPNVGKSCLAGRLVNDQYEEHGTTHGMRFWTRGLERLPPEPPPSPEGHRDVTLWDMGGQ